MSMWGELARDLRKYAGLPVQHSDQERSLIYGLYTMECRSKKGQLLWRETFHNLITNVGWAFLWDGILQTAVTINGPFLGLMGNATGTPAPTIAAGDTMASHAGWTECGLAVDPHYTVPRKTTVGQWSAAVAATRTKALSAPQSFAMTTTGSVLGAFMVTSTGAVSTVDSTAGTLFSAGAMTAQPVANGNTLSVSWSIQGT